MARKSVFIGCLNHLRRQSVLPWWRLNGIRRVSTRFRHVSFISPIHAIGASAFSGSCHSFESAARTASNFLREELLVDGVRISIRPFRLAPDAYWIVRQI